MVKYFFQGKEPNFIPQLHLTGTDFQKRVWQALLKIPYGTTTTYKDTAMKAAQDKKHLPLEQLVGLLVEIISALLFLATVLSALTTI